MKILVFSDTHGHCASMCTAIDREMPDYVIHLGDHTRDAENLRSLYPMLPILSVRGNCDYNDWSTPEIHVANFDGVQILCVHGHNYNVKGGLLRLYMAAKEKAVQIALFGHTHCAYCEEKDGLWLLNPGTCGRGNTATYAIVTVNNGKVACKIHTIDERTDVR